MSFWKWQSYFYELYVKCTSEGGNDRDDEIYSSLKTPTLVALKYAEEEPLVVPKKSVGLF